MVGGWVEEGLELLDKLFLTKTLPPDNLTALNF